MPSPSTALATLRPDLAGVLAPFDSKSDQQGFVGHRILTVIDVPSQAGSFGKITLDQLLKNVATARAPQSGYPRTDWQFTTDTYACEENGVEEPIDDRQARMYRDYFDAESYAAMHAQDVIVRNAELRAAALLFDPAVWTGADLTTAVGTEWSDPDSAPIDDIDAAKRKIWLATGMWPNALLINRRVMMNLRRVQQVIDSISSAGAGASVMARDITAERLAQVFDLEEVVVSGSPRNAANEGQAVDLQPIFSDEYAMLCRVGRTGDIQEPCIGRTFHWSEDGSQIGGTVETYRDEKVRGDVVRVRHDTHEKILYPELGHLLSNITA